VTVLPGAELSCRWHQVEPSIPLHLLAYLFDPDQPELVAALTRVRASRSRRTRRMVDLLVADGIDVTVAEIEADAAGGTIGRPHVARALVRRGLVPDVHAAFAPHWLGERYRVPKEDLDVFEALRLIRGAGGVAVFAHPRATRRGRIVPDELIAQLAAEGLFGLEAEHPDHTPAERAHVRGLAGELGLVVTGSSDFHGTNKTVRLAECTTAPEVYHRIVDAGVGEPWVP
jgi:predicted metal-dependent phosphoesterase TrpH